MEKNVLIAKSRSEFRRWLEANAASETECWLDVRRGKPTDPEVFYYLDAVEEALCFGWIDSTVKPFGELRLQRFSPRKRGSAWSELNLARIERLESLGLMTELGRAAAPERAEFALDPDVEKALRENGCLEIFLSFPALYQKIRAYNVAFYKKRDPALYEKALANLIRYTKNGKMFGQWNDYGRLG